MSTATETKSHLLKPSCSRPSRRLQTCGPSEPIQNGEDNRDGQDPLPAPPALRPASRDQSYRTSHHNIIFRQDVSIARTLNLTDLPLRLAGKSLLVRSTLNLTDFSTVQGIREKERVANVRLCVWIGSLLTSCVVYMLYKSLNGGLSGRSCFATVGLFCSASSAFIFRISVSHHEYRYRHL